MAIRISIRAKIPTVAGDGDSTVGPTGPAGASAFAIAQINGFTGTEQEWLASLEGQDGATGSTGPQGDIGPTGAAGQDGIQGIPGQDGATGPTGAAGQVGPTGPQGAEGRFTYISDTVPENGEEGESWFNSNNGQIFIFYDGFWVESASSNIGPQGETGATGPTGAIGPTGSQGLKGEDGQFTFVSGTVPENGEEGNSWFNSSNGQIYIYYDGFWVESASSNIGPAGPTGPEGAVDIVEAPASPTSPGTPGDVAFDANYIYICTAQDTWVRANRVSW